jgi:hypothetical protein
MPLTIPGATATLAIQLAGVLHIGPGAIKLASGVSAGINTWAHTLTVLTADTGFSGTGVGTVPLLVPFQLFIPALTFGFAAQNILGVMAPLTIMGLATGLNLAFLQAAVVTAHPTVGVGACVCTFKSASAIPAMIAGFATQGMVNPGSIKMATAIGSALDIVFTALQLPSPIVGAPGPSPAAGVGVGTIL